MPRRQEHAHQRSTQGRHEHQETLLEFKKGQLAVLAKIHQLLESLPRLLLDSVDWTCLGCQPMVIFHGACSQPRFCFANG
jgi:hypothetical protein